MIYEDCQENSFIRVILKLSLPEAEELLLQNCFPLNLLCVKTEKFALIYSVYSFCFLNSNVEVKTVKPRDGKQQWQLMENWILICSADQAKIGFLTTEISGETILMKYSVIIFSCSLILVRRMWNVFWRWNREEKNWNGTQALNSSGSVLVWLFLVLVNFYCHLELNFKITFLLDYFWVKEKVVVFFF